MGVWEPGERAELGLLGLGGRWAERGGEARVWGLTERHSKPGALVETEKKVRLGADRETNHGGA